MLERVAQTLVLIGALNWGIIGLFGQVNDPGTKFLGAFPTFLSVLYIVVGIAALYLIWINLENIVPSRNARTIQRDSEMPTRSPTPPKKLIAHKTTSTKVSKA